MKQFLKNLYNNKFNNFAFSLIELSIVLIIIGLLIAGVMGGQSLIENAKIISLTREIRDWKQAINTFYVAKGRLPSDANNDGKIGYGSDEGHLDHYFPPPYNGQAVNGESYQVWNGVSGPFVDLYLAKISDFKPTSNRGTMQIDNIFGEHGLPESQVLKNEIYYYYAYVPGMLGTYVVNNDKNYKDITTNALILDANKYYKRLPNQITKKIDFKMDDGKINSGSVRTECAEFDNYNNIVDKKTKCQAMIFILDIR